MRIITLIYSFIFFLPTVLAQDTEKYKGSFSTNLSSSGEASYTYYYLPEKRKRIKHGRFKYILRHNSGNYKIYQTVYGHYKNDKKHGSWSIKTTIKDLKHDIYDNQILPENYVSGNITMVANYKEGKPSGKWFYQSNLRSRRVEGIVNGRKDWSGYELTRHDHIKIFFDNLTLKDTVRIEFGEYSLEGLLSENGFMKDTWQGENMEYKVVDKYENGYLVHRNALNKQTEKMEYTKASSKTYENKVFPLIQISESKPELLPHQELKLDTINNLQNPEHPVGQIINQAFFNNPFFLFRDLPGNKFDPKMIRGMYEINLSAQTTIEQSELIDSIRKMNHQTHSHYQYLVRYTKNKPLSERIKNILSITEYYHNQNKRYECLAANVIRYNDIKEGMKKAYEDCRHTISLTEDLPNFKNKDEALEFFCKKSGQNLKSSEKYRELIVKRLLKQ